MPTCGELNRQRSIHASQNLVTLLNLFRVKSSKPCPAALTGAFFRSLTTSIWRMQRTSFDLGIVKTVKRFMIRLSSSKMTPALTDTLQPVELAEGVEIQLRVAGPGVRSLAWTLDLAIAIACYIALAIVMGLLGFFGMENVWQGVLLLFMFFFNWFYNVFFEMTARGATPGQRHCGIKVVSLSGGPVRLPQSLIRNLLRVIDFMPVAYLFGFLCTLCNRRFQRLGDLVADTVVVYADPKIDLTQRVHVNADPCPPPMPLSRAEQAAVLQFLERAPSWSEERRIEMADLLSPLTGATGPEGLRRLCAIALWLRQSGQPAKTFSS
jgi:uncharacterized RDD family membrane protein YckC